MFLKIFHFLLTNKTCIHCTRCRISHNNKDKNVKWSIFQCIFIRSVFCWVTIMNLLFVNNKRTLKRSKFHLFRLFSFIGSKKRSQIQKKKRNYATNGPNLCIPNSPLFTRTKLPQNWTNEVVPKDPLLQGSLSPSPSLRSSPRLSYVSGISVLTLYIRIGSMSISCRMTEAVSSLLT